MKKTIYIALLALFFVKPVAKAQVVTSLYFMDNLPQASSLNPAMDPNYNFYLGLPVINNVNINLSSDIGIGDIYKNGNYPWNSNDLYEAFLDDLPKTSFLATEVNTSIFNMGFRSGKGFVHIAVNTRMDFKFGIPKDLFKLNDLTINHDFSGFGAQARLFNEFALGYSREINEKLTVGAKVKYLAGVANASVLFDKFDITTTEEAWGVNVEGAMDVSGPLEFTYDENDFPSNVEITENFDDPMRIFDLVMAKGGNSGYGIDLGVEYQIIPRLKLSASLIDLGKINWKSNVNNVNFQAQYSHTGFNDIIKTGDEGVPELHTDVFEGILDSLKNSYSSDPVSEPFSNRLNPKLYIAAEYELTKSLSVGAISRTLFIGEERRQNYIFAANANFKRLLTLGANYNYGVGSQSSYGGVLGLRIFPLYIYFAADVLPGYAPGGSKITMDGEVTEFPVSVPANLSAANFQFGVNITLGERRRQLAKREKKAVKPLYEKAPGTSSFDYPF